MKREKIVYKGIFRLWFVKQVHFKKLYSSLVSTRRKGSKL